MRCGAAGASQAMQLSTRGIEAIAQREIFEVGKEVADARIGRLRWLASGQPRWLRGRGSECRDWECDKGCGWW